MQPAARFKPPVVKNNTSILPVWDGENTKNRLNLGVSTKMYSPIDIYKWSGPWPSSGNLGSYSVAPSRLFS
jgi:hypothetical protein